MQREIMRILAFAGSIRKDSFNKALLINAVNVKPTNMQMEIIELNLIPEYNDDLAHPQPPKPVSIFRQKVEQADGLLIATPEYNYSIPGVLKNALDWASTNLLGNVLDKKHVAIMGASKTRYGTVRAQSHLRQVLHAVNALVLNKPELMVAKSSYAFDVNGNLEDEKALAILRKLLQSLYDQIVFGN